MPPGSKSRTPEPRPRQAPAPAKDAAAELAALCHKRARADRATETAEDYVEQIADLIASGGEARVVDLARRLGVTHVTVVRTVERLQKAGLVSSKPYRSIFLTAAGAELAERCRKRHVIVVDFLRALGVSEAAAQEDAEGIEHHVSDETLAAFARFAGRAGGKKQQMANLQMANSQGGGGR